MAYDYLGITNDVIARVNEVQLTATTFSSARGIQVQCQNAVNDAIGHINAREFTWPFNHSTQTETLVAGTTRYSIPSTAKYVDYDTFRITKDTSLGSEGGGLYKMDYKEYMDKYVDQEDDATVAGGVPTHIIRTPDNNYLLYPYPDAAYELKYEAYLNTTRLSAATDVPDIPEQYRHIITDGATAYVYQYRGEEVQFDLNWGRFEEGINHMQNQLINRDDYLRSYQIIRPYGSGGYLRTT